MQNRSLIKPPKSVIEESRRQKHGNVFYRFPDDLGAHAIVLNFKNYSFSQTPAQNTINNRGSIVLPLPSNLTESFDVRMNGVDLKTLGNTIAKGVDNAGRGEATPESLGASLVKGIIDAYNDVTSDFDKNNPLSSFSEWGSATKFLLRNQLDRISPTASAAVDVGLGTAMNPHVAVNFDGMNLRNHTLAWSFAPKSREESDKLRSIQNFLRREITPKFVGDGATIASRTVLRYPSMVDLFFVGIDPGYFYYFKRCLVQSMAMDYTPTGGHAILQGGKPAFVNMSLQLIETSIHTTEDYE